PVPRRHSSIFKTSVDSASGADDASLTGNLRISAKSLLDVGHGADADEGDARMSVDRFNKRGDAIFVDLAWVSGQIKIPHPASLRHWFIVRFGPRTDRNVRAAEALENFRHEP